MAEGATSYQLTVRAKMVEAARAMLRGELSFLEGARLIVALGRDAGLMHGDKNIVPFVSVESQTDHLPLGDQRQHWQAAALTTLRPEIDRWEAFARKSLRKSCRDLIKRFEVGSTSCEA